MEYLLRPKSREHKKLVVVIVMDKGGSSGCRYQKKCVQELSTAQNEEEESFDENISPTRLSLTWQVHGSRTFADESSFLEKNFSSWLLWKRRSQ
jgi:hypothetical protein